MPSACPIPCKLASYAIQTTYSQEQIDSAIVYALGKLGVENLKNKRLEAVETFVNSSDTFELVYDGSTAWTLPPFPLGHDPSSMYIPNERRVIIRSAYAFVYYKVHVGRPCGL